MDDVRIVLTASRTPLGAVIRWVTKSPVSHCLIEFPVWGRRMVAEAGISGVRVVPSLRARHHVVAEYRCRFGARAGLAAIADEMGKRYDYGGLLVIAWVCILKAWFHVRVRRLRWRTSAVKCSELVAIFLFAAGVAKEGELSRELTTPADIQAFCRDHVADFEVVSEASH
jgi:hypothetical protein